MYFRKDFFGKRECTVGPINLETAKTLKELISIHKDESKALYKEDLIFHIITHGGDNEEFLEYFGDYIPEDPELSPLVLKMFTSYLLYKGIITTEEFRDIILEIK